jgi:choline-sulfatase
MNTRLFTICLLLTAAAGCVVGESPASRPNVILAVFDACRPDKIGTYGFVRQTTPVLDRLAEDPASVVFERHYVQADWTKPSTASLFTGWYVNQHRVALGHEPAAEESVNAGWTQVLPEEMVTLAESFRDAGYFTAGLIRIPHLHPRYGFSQGFEVYVYSDDDERMVAQALEVAGEAGRPFFMYLHFLGCHAPFPAETRDPAYLEAHGFPYDEAARKGAGVDFENAGINKDFWEGNKKLETEDVRFLHLVYEAQMRRTDEKILRPLLEGLRQQGLFDETLFAFTADHGTELYDHESYSHGHALWEEIIHVPLVIKFPEGPRPEKLLARWDGLTRAIDLYPTLLSAAEIEIPDHLAGRDLLQAPSIDVVIAERDVNDWALIRGYDKVLQSPSGTARVFDLAADPTETRDLAGARQELVEQARRLAARHHAQHPSRMTGPSNDVPGPTEEELEILRSLGYVQ